MKLITCAESDVIRADNRGISSTLTNWVGGRVVNPMLPPETRTVWLGADGTEMLFDCVGRDGCRHEVPDGMVISAQVMPT